MNIQVKDIYKYYKSGKTQIKAVDGVSFEINEGEILGLVGESGCGKSTIGKCLVKLIHTDKGEISYSGIPEDKKGKLQMIFQNPYNSLNPSVTIGETLERTLRAAYPNSERNEIDVRVKALLAEVGIAEEFIHKYPFELSGGQCQRIGIARALATEPCFIVCDEPVSALDVSVQAYIINIIRKISKERNLTSLFISHDLNLVRYVSDRVLVMYLGKIVEEGSSSEVFRNPAHPYTKMLLDSMIPLDPAAAKAKDYAVRGEAERNPDGSYAGCAFAPRCRYAMEECFRNTPASETVAPGHKSACFLNEEHRGRC